MPLYRLAYYSENRIPDAPESLRAEIEQILQTSRRNNALVGLTGALMFSSGYFGQVLEGPQPAIEVTFERIQQDMRHGDVALLEFVPVTERAFDRWNMAYLGEQPDAFADFLSNDRLDMNAIGGDRLFLRLKEMVGSANSW